MLASANGLLAVCLGAFGSHGLRARLPENLMSAWSTGVQYHFYHVFALALVGVLIQQGFRGRLFTASGILFSCGVLLFCGSLYGLALGGPVWLGPVTPVGGLCLILGWLSLCMGVVKNVHRQE